MTNGILLNGSADIDFMIHGVFPYQFFGQTVWITTTHICLLIVLADPCVCDCGKPGDEACF